MLRAFGAFLLVFALLSLIVHLNRMVGMFGAGAVTLLVIDMFVAHAPRGVRNARIKSQPLL